MKKLKRTSKKPEYYQVESEKKKKKHVRLENKESKSSCCRIIPKEDLLVWGRCKGYGWWPGRIANQKELSGPIDLPNDPTRWIMWFGDYKFTETKVDEMAYFHDFTLFKENVYNRRLLYHQAVNSALREAAKRAGRRHDNDVENLSWAKNNFFPEGYNQFIPNPHMDIQCQDISKLDDLKKSDLLKNHNCKDDFSTANQLEHAFNKLKDGIVNIEKICLACGSLEVVSSHPLFLGGLCDLCQIDYKECAYLLDDQGFLMYCSVCAGGKEVVTCDNTNCVRSFCKTCMESIVAGNAFEKAADSNPWLCYICVEKSNHGFLTRRCKWAECLFNFINDNECTTDFEFLSIPPNIPVADRRGIRVLSLFDGIATGCLVLKQLNIEIKSYHASEIDHDAICITETRHPSTTTCIGDVREINDKMLNEFGPFDLVIGGSPCNDLSIANPLRKGLWSDKGTGCLFFEFLRILRSCQVMAAAKGRFVFWMFENVVCMDKSTKTNISRFLQKNPVCLDASVVSPAHRARYYWGNLPGMNRPMVASACHKLRVQDCLEPGRSTTTHKLRTITTNAASLRQCNDKSKSSLGQAIVMQQRNQKDRLWVTELERIFGFPDHYTDVSNLARSGRLRLLGKSWSVPVIKHLFSPLKDFFSTSV